jgi:hypothetical protein
MSSRLYALITAQSALWDIELKAFLKSMSIRIVLCFKRCASLVIQSSLSWLRSTPRPALPPSSPGTMRFSASVMVVNLAGVHYVMDQLDPNIEEPNGPASHSACRLYLLLCGGAVLSNSERHRLVPTRHSVHPLKLGPPILARPPALLQLVSEIAHRCSCPVLLLFEV